MKTLAARRIYFNRGQDVPEVCDGAYAPSGRRRRNPRCPGRIFKKMLCPGNSVSPWFAASCCRDGSLAVIWPIWIQEASEESSSCGSVHFILQIAYIGPSEILALRTKELVPPLVPLLPCWSVAIAASETVVSTKTGVRDVSVLTDQRWLRWVKKLLPALKAGNPEEKIWKFHCLAAAFLFTTELCKKCKNDVGDTTLPIVRSEIKRNTCVTFRGVVDQAFGANA